VDIANLGNQTFNGFISADLYNSEGEYVAELALTSIELASSQYIDNLQLNSSGVDVPAGSYILAIWETQDAVNWTLVGSDNYPNPIIVQVAATPDAADIYENNDDEATAFLLPLNMPGNQVTLYTNGSTLHMGNDLDYYRMDLPAGSQYKIIPLAHDNYNEPENYTVDVLWALGAGGQWSDVYDDAMEGFFVVNGGQTVYLVVSNYYQGNTGTYLLEIAIEKGTFGVDEIKDSDFVNLFPNPSSGMVTLSSDDWSKLSLPLEIEITDMTGRSVYSSSISNSDNFHHRLDLADLQEGVYYLRVTGQKGYIDKKLVILR
jgi:hypothetical protein